MNELLQYADDEGQERWDKLSLGYVEPSQGSDYLRQEILEAQFDNNIQNNITIDSVNVCAPQEGIFLAIQAVCEPGDHVVVVVPAYQSLHEIAASIGCQLDSWWPEPSDGNGESLEFRPETLQQLLRPGKTKLVVANFPHNPTGALPTHQQFQQMVSIVQEAGAWFLVDEMYRGLEHGNTTHPLPAIADCMEKGISLSGMSKSYGLPGLRIGWVVNRDTDFQKRVAELKDYVSICPPAPSEALAFIALRAQQAIWERSRAILANGLPRLRQFVQQHQNHPKYAFEWCEPMGGTFAWVKFQRSDPSMTASEYTNAVRQRTGLMMVPSGLFPECKASDDRIRLTYGKTGLEDLLQVWEQDLQQDLGMGTRSIEHAVRTVVS